MNIREAFKSWFSNDDDAKKETEKAIAEAKKTLAEVEKAKQQDQNTKPEAEK